MYAIYINDIEIEFDGKISGKLFNPFFWEFSNYSYPFEIPLTITNKKAINFANLIEVSKLDTVYFDTVIETPYFKLTGKCKFLGFNTNSIKLSFEENFDFWDTIKNYNLNDLGLVFFTNLNSTTRANSKMALAPVYNANFAGNFPYGITINPFINYNLPSDYFTDWLTNNGYTYQGFPKLSYLLEKIFEYFGYTVIYNGVSLDINYSVFYLYINFFPWAYTFSRDNRIRGENVTNITFDDDDVIITHEMYSLTPVLNELVRFYGLLGTTELNGKVCQVTEVIDNYNFKIDISSEGLSPFIYGGNDVGEFDTVKPQLNRYGDPTQNIWPTDWTINKFLQQVSKWGISFFIDNQTKKVIIKTYNEIFRDQNVNDITNISEKIRDIVQSEYDSFEIKYAIDSTDELSAENYSEISDEYILKDTVATLNALPVSGEYNEVRYVTSELAYYRYIPHINTANSVWEFLSKGSIHYKTEGDVPFVHEIELYPLFKTTANHAGIGTGVTLLNIKQAINANFLPDRDNSPIRLFLFFGNQDTALPGVQFPLATTDFYDHSGNPMTEYTLDIGKIEGTYGIYNKLLKKFIDWQVNTRKDVKTHIHWPQTIMRNFDFSKKVRIKYSNYFVKVIPYTIDFGKNRVDFGETELCKV